jgi:uncharacterized membrane protein required for colicin V production
MLTILMVVIIVTCVAFLYTEGMWGNAIRLINVVTAALLATSFWEPLADWLEGSLPSYTYLWDFLSLWALFCGFMIVLRLLTNQISKVRVRFLKIADRIGSGVLALMVGWVIVCFTMMSLHTAPLGKTFLFDNFQPEESMVMGTAPDQKWLGFVRNLSCGAYCRSMTEAQWEQRKFVFDPYGEFVDTYDQRRDTLEKHNKATGEIRVRQ